MSLLLLCLYLAILCFLIITFCLLGWQSSLKMKNKYHLYGIEIENYHIKVRIMRIYNIFSYTLFSIISVIVLYFLIAFFSIEWIAVVKSKNKRNFYIGCLYDTQNIRKGGPVYAMIPDDKSIKPFTDDAFNLFRVHSFPSHSKWLSGKIFNHRYKYCNKVSYIHVNFIFLKANIVYDFL